MTDIRKALETARRELARWDGLDRFEDLSPEHLDDYMKGTRAAVLAFLKTMPEGYRAPILIDGLPHSMAMTWTPARLAAAIEEDR